MARNQMSHMALAFIFLVMLMSASAGGSSLPSDPNGHVVVTWDILSWEADGYVAEVRIENKQLYRSLYGWSLGFTWTAGELISTALGAEATFQGDCSNATEPGAVAPHCCASSPTIVDLLPTAEASLKVANCCRSGVLLSTTQEVNSTAARFQMSIINAYNTIDTVIPPSNFTLMGDDYTCTAPAIVNSTLFTSVSGNRVTQAFRTFQVNCTYVQAVAEPVPGCCVSLSTFYNATVTPCATCACACGSFDESDSLCDVASPLAYLLPAASDVNSTYSPWARECSADGCPVSVHWHLQTNYEGYFEVRLTITNRMLFQSYSNWTLTLEHPDLDNITSIDNFGTTGIMPYGVNDTSVLYGLPYVSESLLVAPGYVQATLLIGKDDAFTLEHGYAFPTSVSFNGQKCVMPTSFPSLPSGSFRFAQPSYILMTIAAILLSIALVWS